MTAKNIKIKLILFIATFLTCTLNAQAIEKTSPLSITVKGKGKPMILIPGLNSAISVWDETVEHYQDNYECHLVQLAGFAGAKPVDFDSAFLDKVKEALIQYIADEELSQPVMIGHSLGGFLTMMISAEKPDLLGAMVIVDAAPFFSALMYPNATVESSKPMAVQMRNQMENQSAEQLKATLPQYLAPLTIGEERLKTLVDWGISSDAETSAQAMYELYTTDLRDDLAKINNPALILIAWVGYQSYGATRENTLSKYNQQFAKLRNHQIKVTDKGKHFIMWDDPDFFFSSIDAFLAGNQ